MSKDKYVAYVGTYTHGSSIGIHVYDLDVENGYMTEREVVPVNNASHVAKSNNGKYLYSIADEGVEVLKIKEDGGLEPINKVGIDGMRGCFLSTDKEGKFLLFAATMTARSQWCVSKKTEVLEKCSTAFSIRDSAALQSEISARVSPVR